MIQLSPPVEKQINQPGAKLQLLDVTILNQPLVSTGLNEHPINLDTLELFSNRSHTTSTKEKYQRKTTLSVRQIDTTAIITERNYALIPITTAHLGQLGGYTLMNSLDCQKHNSHQRNHHETNQLIPPEQMYLHRKLTHLQRTHQNTFCMVSTPMERTVD